jgi:plasmid stability protein
MPALYVRNVPPELYEALRARAEREGRSISAQTIAILKQELGFRRDPEELLAEIRAFKKRVPWPADAPTPEEIIRKDRDSH